VPRFTPRPLHVGRTLRLTRWLCDGHDAPRPVAEASREPVVMLLLSGRFAFRDRWGRTVASPSLAIAVDVDHEFEIRHPAAGCGDVTLAITGAVPRSLLEPGRTARPVSAAAYLRLARLAAAPAPDALAAEETAVLALDALAPDGEPAPPRPASAADREVAAAIDHAIAVAGGAGVDLAALAAEAQVTTAHACRAYRRATGTTIHARVVEARLRQALALVVDTAQPLAEVAMTTGFANQGHLGNAFRRRFGTSPGRARRRPDLIRP
jgi:AraC-like DNA-binding protein